MARGRSERVRSIIEQLNALGVGEVSAIDAKLQVARNNLQEIGVADVGDTVEQARVQLGKGQVSEFRRLVSQAVSRLGHQR